MNQGIYDVPREAYHADKMVNGVGEVLDERPALSASIASLLVRSSPLHAWAAHPKLNPNFKEEEKATYDVGTAAHALMLEGLDIVEVLPFPNFRTNAAQEARDAARAAGKVPLLVKTMEEVKFMRDAIAVQLSAHSAMPVPFTDGKPEQTLVWEEDGVLCKARPDWIHNEAAVMDDLKTTSTTANPAAYSRRLFEQGGDVQAAWYLRGYLAVTGGAADFRWVIVESKPPYALSIVAPHPHVLMLANKKIDFAINLWKLCLANDTWPGYPTDICYAELPPWEEERWLEKELREAT